MLCSIPYLTSFDWWPSSRRRPSYYAVGFGQLQPTPSRIGPPVADGGNAAASGGALPPEIMELRREGHEALYNLDSAATAKFEEIRRLAPHHPAGDLYLATILWLGHLNKTRRLQSGLYGSGSSFYADVDKAKEGSEGDAVDADVDRAFREKMAQAKTKALALVARNKNDADALYFGAYYGVMAGCCASVARKFQRDAQRFAVRGRSRKSPEAQTGLL